MLRSYKMFVFAGLLFLCLTTANAVQAKQKDAQNQGMPLSQIDRQHVLQDNFVLVKTVQALPKTVQNSLRGNHGDIGMADAGQPFERTDYIIGKPLPLRRLIFAAISPGYCLVYNEHGGYGYWTQVVLYRLSSGQAILVWGGTPRERMDILTWPQLRSAVADGKFADDQLPQPQAAH